MGFFSKLFGFEYPLLKATYIFSGMNPDNIEIEILNPEIKLIEYVHLSLYQFSRIMYIIPRNFKERKLVLEILNDLNNVDNPERYINELLIKLRELPSDQNTKDTKFISTLFYISATQRSIKTKLPLSISNNESVRTVILSINEAISISTSLEVEILKTGISYQARQYLTGYDYRNMRNMISMPLEAFLYGMENRKLVK